MTSNTIIFRTGRARGVGRRSDPVCCVFVLATIMISIRTALAHDAEPPGGARRGTALAHDTQPPGGARGTALAHDTQPPGGARGTALAHDTQPPGGARGTALAHDAQPPGGARGTALAHDAQPPGGARVSPPSRRELFRSDSGSDPTVSRLATWLRAECHATGLDNLFLQDFARTFPPGVDSLRGVGTLRQLEVGEDAFCVAKRCWLGEHTWPPHIRDVKAMAPQCRRKWHLTAIWIAEELQNPDSFFAPYLEGLPTEEEFALSHPAWTPALVEEAHKTCLGDNESTAVCEPRVWEPRGENLRVLDFLLRELRRCQEDYSRALRSVGGGLVGAGRRSAGQAPGPVVALAPNHDKAAENSPRWEPSFEQLRYSSFHPISTSDFHLLQHLHRSTGGIEASPSGILVPDAQMHIVLQHSIMHSILTYRVLGQQHMNFMCCCPRIPRRSTCCCPDPALLMSEGRGSGVLDPDRWSGS